jgi:hypothetical protein
MNVRIILHVAEGDHLLFEGPHEDCPPLPQTGDEIIHADQRLRLEGVRFQYQPDHFEISLLA